MKWRAGSSPTKLRSTTEPFCLLYAVHSREFIYFTSVILIIHPSKRMVGIFANCTITGKARWFEKSPATKKLTMINNINNKHILQLTPKNNPSVRI